MALALSNLAASGSASALSTYTTASISPTNGNLVLLSLCVIRPATNITNKADIPTVTGAGLTWNWLYNNHDNTNAQILYIVYWAIADASATPGTVSIVFPVSQLRLGWAIDTVSGIDSSSPYAWCVQAQTAVMTFTTAGTTIPLLTPLQDTSSVCYGVAFFNGGGGGLIGNLNPNSGFTQLSRQGTSANNTALATEYKVNDANVGWTMSTGGPAAGFGFSLEITALNTGARNSPLVPHNLGLTRVGV